MSLDVRSLLFGKDNTSQIVSVKPSLEGKATIWRRINNRIFCQEKKLRNWLALSDTSLLNGFDKRKYDLIEFEGSHPFKYGVMTYRYRELRDHIQLTSGSSGLNEISSVLSFPAMEQFLIGSGMTYFKEMNYDEILRLQFDIETYGLDPKEAAIFLIVISDSSGYKRVLDDREMSEAEMIFEFSRIIKERDPDALENHNIFGFDIPFLAERANLHGIHFDIGRDGSGFMSHRAMLKVGAMTEPFFKYLLSGREIIDTLQAVKRYNAFARTMKSHDLKYSSKYFGLESKDREYIEGSEISSLWRSDPERVVKYAFDDVEEVDKLSRLLMGSAFALSQMVPSNYDKVAHSGTASLIDLILTRGYLMHRHSLPSPSQDWENVPGADTRVFVRGVVQNVVKADIESLYPSIMLEYNIKPKSDSMNIFLLILKYLKELRVQHKAQSSTSSTLSAQRGYHNAMQSALKVLINSFYGYLGTGFARFNDLQAASEVTHKGREILKKLCDEIVKRGGKLVEIDTDGAYFIPPIQLKDISEQEAFVEKLSSSLEEGIKVSYDGSWKAMYSYTMKNYALLDYEDRLKLMGVAFKSSQREEIFTDFLEKSIGLMLKGNLSALRGEYLGLIKRIKSHQLPIEKLLRTTRLSKSVDEYKKNKERRPKQSYYDLLISAGIDGQAGDQVSYYNCGKDKNDNSWKLASEYENDYNVDFYIEQLKSVTDTLKFAFNTEDFFSLFAPDDQLFLLNTPIEKIKTIAVDLDEREAEKD